MASNGNLVDYVDYETQLEASRAALAGYGQDLKRIANVPISQTYRDVLKVTSATRIVAVSTPFTIASLVQYRLVDITFNPTSGIVTLMWRWALKSKNLNSFGLAFTRVVVCLAFFVTGIAVKAVTIYCGSYGAYVMPPWITPLIGFLVADFFLYACLLSMIVLSLMRSRDQAGSKSVVIGRRVNSFNNNSSIEQQPLLIPVEERGQNEAPAHYQI